MVWTGPCAEMNFCSDLCFVDVLFIWAVFIILPVGAFVLVSQFRVVVYCESWQMQVVSRARSDTG